MGMTDLTLFVAGVGAVPGIISLCWLILNSRPKLIFESVHFVRSHRHAHREVIDVTVKIRNKRNCATTIEDIILVFGNRWIPQDAKVFTEIKSNSSFNIDLHQRFTLEEFKEIFGEEKVKVGIYIVHTFGKLKKFGLTDFNTDYLNL